MSYTFSPTKKNDLDNVKELFRSLIHVFVVLYIATYVYVKLYGIYEDNDTLYNWQVWVMTKGDKVLMLALVMLIVLNL